MEKEFTRLGCAIMEMKSELEQLQQKNCQLLNENAELRRGW